MMKILIKLINITRISLIFHLKFILLFDINTRKIFSIYFSTNTLIRTCVHTTYYSLRNSSNNKKNINKEKKNEIEKERRIFIIYQLNYLKRHAPLEIHNL